MITVKNLTKRYGQAVVVDDVSFTVAAGEAVALWGPNGAGKSTVVRCILGSIAFEGSIEVAGFDVRRRGKAARSHLGYVPQQLAFFDDMTVGETIALTTRLRGVDMDRGKDRLEQMGLADQWDKLVGALSGGMKQRLGITLALLADPPVLLLDEPTSSLDLAARDSVLAVFEHLRDEQRAIVLTSHNLEEVGMIAERVIAMEGGVMKLECRPADLAERLGLRAWLHVVVGGGQLDRAIAVLLTAGFVAKRNSTGVLVDVPAGDKARALTTLQHAGLEVVDVDVWR